MKRQKKRFTEPLMTFQPINAGIISGLADELEGIYQRVNTYFVELNPERYPGYQKTEKTTG